MKTINSIFLILLIFGCSNKPVRTDLHPEMGSGYLVPRPGYEGHLTHQNKHKHIKKYELNENFLKSAQMLKISCQVAGQRYRVCADQLGLCRTEMVARKVPRKGLDRIRGKYKIKMEKIVKFLPFENYELLINAGTYCRSGL